MACDDVVCGDVAWSVMMWIMKFDDVVCVCVCVICGVICGV